MWFGRVVVILAVGVGAQWAVQSGSNYCSLTSLSTGELCVQDTAGTYGNNEHCTFTYAGSASLIREEWGLEQESSCAYDYLAVGDDSVVGNRYCGGVSALKAFPDPLVVNGTTSFKFSTDGSAHGTGFKICAVPTEQSTDVTCATGMSSYDWLSPTAVSGNCGCASSSSCIAATTDGLDSTHWDPSGCSSRNDLWTIMYDLGSTHHLSTVKVSSPSSGSGYHTVTSFKVGRHPARVV
jgi:hypothetical protein